MNNIQWNMLHMLINFSEIYLCYWFFCERLHKHFSGTKKWLLMAFFTAVTFLADKLGIDPVIRNCCIFIAGTLFTAWIYKSTMAVSALLNALFFFTVIASQCLVGGLLLLLYKETDISLIMQEPFLWVQCMAFSKLMNFIFIVLCIKLLDRRKEKCTLKEAGILLVQAVSSIFSLVMIVEFSSNQTGKAGLGIVFLGILAFVIIISYFMSYYMIDGYFSFRTKEKEFLLMDMRSEKMMANYTQIEQNQQNVYRLYHDLKKHVNTMLLLGNSEEADQYMEELLKDIRNVNGEFQTGNRFVDAILYDEWKKAVDSGIRVQFAVESGSFDNMNLSDVTIILGNALENAREACVKRVANGQSAYMQLKVMKQSHQLLMVISNEFDGVLLKKDNQLLSSKENKHLHGVGIKSIQAAVEKYNGTMKVSAKDGKFKLIILLCFEDDTN